MSDTLIIGYLLVGIVVYVATMAKVSEFERTIASHLPINPVGYKAALLALIAGLWPIWLMVLPSIKEKEGPF